MPGKKNSSVRRKKAVDPRKSITVLTATQTARLSQYELETFVEEGVDSRRDDFIPDAWTQALKDMSFADDAALVKAIVEDRVFLNTIQESINENLADNNLDMDRDGFFSFGDSLFFDDLTQKDNPIFGNFIKIVMQHDKVMSKQAEDKERADRRVTDIENAVKLLKANGYKVVQTAPAPIIPNDGPTGKMVLARKTAKRPGMVHNKYKARPKPRHL